MQRRLRTRPFRILSIDGGGVRGIIPAVFLRHLENTAKVPLSDMFDMVAGTSTGAIVAALTVLPPPSRTDPTRITGDKIVEMYNTLAREVFPIPKEKDGWSAVVKAKAKGSKLLGPQYCPQKLEKLLAESCGNTLMSGTVKPILCTAYEMSTCTPKIFSTVKAHADHCEDVLVKDVCRASSAAPTVFEPHVINGHTYVDGGFFANNPTMLAYLEAKEVAVGLDYVVVSCGTGRHPQNISYDDCKGWGALQWATPALDIAMDSSNEIVHYQMTRLLREGSQYFRLQPVIPKELGEIDNSRDENVAALCAKAEEYLSSNYDVLMRMADRLLTGYGGGDSTDSPRYKEGSPDGRQWSFTTDLKKKVGL